MSDFFRRASDAFHRQRQGSAGSTGSTDAPKSPDAAKPPEQEPIDQTSEPAQPDSRVNEAFAGTATENVAHPKQRRHWPWGHHQGNKPEAQQQPSQEQPSQEQPSQQQKDDTDWVIGS